MPRYLGVNILQAELFTNGDQLLAVQVAIPGDAQSLTHLLQLLLYPVLSGGDVWGRVQVIGVPESQLP